MATLSVWKFDDPAGADQTEETLRDLARQELITVLDAATVSWPEGRSKPKTTQLSHRFGAGAGAGWGAFWGVLFGLIFFVPLLGAAIGAGLGALVGGFNDAGIDRKFIERVREQVRPGTSALFLLSTDAVVDRVKQAFAGVHVELLTTNLSTEQETALRQAFADE